MSNIAIITARGGSKRIPHKNIKEFCGKPILAYSIDAALKSKIFDNVMVSTDDENIASIAKRYGALVPFMRSKENADDYSTTASVLTEVIDSYKAKGQIFNYMCCLYPTAPFVTAEKLVRAFNKLQEQNVEAVVPVVKYAFPPQRCFIVENGKLQYKWPQHMLTRSQDLTSCYHDAGQFYFIKTDVFLHKKTLIPPETLPYILDEREVQDIDNISDWEIAEIKYRIMNKLMEEK
jgi:N-acylneuraminate cytidylyltransferase